MNEVGIDHGQVVDKDYPQLLWQLDENLKLLVAVLKRRLFQLLDRRPG